MSKLLTISIAAYNVEKYLEKLLDTIIESDCLEEIEVLVVNDGSKDSTLEIAEKYNKKYPQSIFLVDKENGGHGSTINKGIEQATGKYFKVIDGDDWVDAKGLNNLIQKLKNEDSDMIVCDYQEHYEDSGQILDKTYPMFEAGKMCNFNEVCDKVERLVFHALFFKTNILKDNSIKIDENCFYVDAEYVLYPIPYVKTMIYYDYNVYCYRLGNIGQSVSVESLQRNIKQHINVSTSLIKFYKQIDNSVDSNVKKFILNSVACVNNKTYETLLTFPCKKSNKQRIQKFDLYIRENCAEVLECIPTKTIRLLVKNINLYYPLLSCWVKVKKKINR